jgi:hypothetical protein
LISNLLNSTQRFVSNCVTTVLKVRNRLVNIANETASIAVVLIFTLALINVAWMVCNSDLNHEPFHVQSHVQSHVMVDHFHDLVQGR